jgi:hypothetical protein
MTTTTPLTWGEWFASFFWTIPPTPKVVVLSTSSPVPPTHSVNAAQIEAARTQLKSVQTKKTPTKFPPAMPHVQEMEELYAQYRKEQRRGAKLQQQPPQE